ncbi:MAG: RNA polymerase factor sigma-32 [Alphaproteobacteria bacterium]|nr:RNA polymerase factor sigma-32 [Alphaproteobacteria bacterium]
MNHIDDPQTQKANLAYIKSAMDEPVLTKEREQELAYAWRDRQDAKAMQELIKAYMRLVVSAASKFKNYGLPIGDLIQEGNIGLLQAVNRFEPERDIRFSTYATWWIRSCIQDYVLRNWSIVRTGTTAAHKSLFFNLRRLRAKINESSSDGYLTDAGKTQVAKALNVSKKEVEEMEGRMRASDQSLNATFSDDNEEEVGSLLADNGPSPEEIVIGMKDAQSRSKWLAQALGQLSDREQTIIKERHLKHETVTLEELGKDLGISKERVRQLEQKALMKLKINLQKNIKNPSDFYTSDLFHAA